MFNNRFIIFTWLWMGLTCCCLASEQFEQQALLFPDIQGANRLLGANRQLHGLDGVIEADLVYSASWKRFHFLGEYLASTKEAELERLQIGWQFADDSHIWLGRFHVPSNYWTTAFHHGKFLQTSISNPGISEFEDYGGVIPIHSTGLLLDSGLLFNDGAGIKTAVSAGTSPVLEDNFLESFNLLNPSSESDLAFHFRFSYLPDYFKDDQVGIHAVYAHIKAEDASFQGSPISRIELINFGGFFSWRFQEWHVFSVISHVISRLESDRFNDQSSFTAGFLQLEYELDDSWTFYGRLETSRGAGTSNYLHLIPSFTKARQLVGTRFEFLENQALTLELAHVETMLARFNQGLIQWSAVFP